MGSCRYTNLSEKEQNVSEALKHTEDIVIAKAGKRDAIVIHDVKDCTKESE